MTSQFDKNRQKEALQKAMEASVKESQAAVASAFWEVRTTEGIKKRGLERAVEQKRREHQQLLNERRRKLGALLAAEHHALVDELDKNFETMEERRERLVKEAQRLQEARENARLKLVAEKRAIQWRDSVDEIRTHQSMAIVAAVAKGRILQMREKKEIKARKKEEDFKLDMMFKARAQKQLQREQAERQEAHRRSAETKMMLQAQLDERAALKRQRDDEEAQALAVMRAKWDAENAEEERKKQQRLEDAIKREAAVAAYNKHKKEVDSNKWREEAELDMRLLKAALAKEEANKKAERDLKNARKQEMRDYQDILREMMVKEVQDDSYMETLLKMEADKEWEKRESKWNAEAEARKQLMREVDASRIQQIHFKSVRRAQQEAEDAKFIVKMNEEAEKVHSRRREEDKAKKYARVKNNEFVVAQIQEKRLQKQREKDLEDRLNRMEGEADKLYAEKLDALYDEAPSEPDHRRKKVQWYY